jgi:hypothetical protein
VGGKFRIIIVERLAPGGGTAESMESIAKELQLAALSD